MADNGLSPVQHQDIIWTNAELLSTGTLGTKFSQILSEIKKMHLKMSSEIVVNVRALPGRQPTGFFVSCGFVLWKGQLL